MGFLNHEDTKARRDSFSNFVPSCLRGYFFGFVQSSSPGQIDIRVIRAIRGCFAFVSFVQLALCLAVAAVAVLPEAGWADESLRIYDTNLDQAAYATPG